MKKCKCNKCRNLDYIVDGGYFRDAVYCKKFSKGANRPIYCSDYIKDKRRRK